MTDDATPPPSADGRALGDGARNLLYNCAAMASGDSLLMVHEDPALGWYDRAAPMAVAETARGDGIRVTTLEVGGPSADLSLPGDIAAAMARHDQTVFFSRLGDQSRFLPQMTARAPVMAYIRSAADLASNYGRFDHRALLDVKTAINDILDTAGEIRIRCPLGTDMAGRAVIDPSEPEDVSVKRFPMGVFKPVPTTGFCGRVALSRFLVSTGSRPYAPDCARFDHVVIARFEGNRITGFDGSRQSVAAVEAHYRTVSERFGIEPMFIHSWHSGIHPASAYLDAADDHPDRWGNSVFTNPRVLHFHTCGAYPPGEISWTVIDPVIEVDGAVLCDGGRLTAGIDGDLRAVTDRWPGLAELFAEPERRIGLSE